MKTCIACQGPITPGQRTVPVPTGRAGHRTAHRHADHNDCKTTQQGRN